jgi:hypothetical protein
MTEWIFIMSSSSHWEDNSVLLALSGSAALALPFSHPVEERPFRAAFRLFLNPGFSPGHLRLLMWNCLKDLKNDACLDRMAP